MKKFLLSLVLSISCISLQAITLFPHFVDVAGDFSDGTCKKFTDLNISIGCYRESPSFFRNIKDADSFLMDTLPMSSYPIEKNAETLPDGTQIIIYTSSLEADGLYEGKLSKLYLIQTPDENLFVGLYEDQLN